MRVINCIAAPFLGGPDLHLDKGLPFDRWPFKCYGESGSSFVCPQVLGVRLGIALRWCDALRTSGGAGAEDGGEDALAAVGARQVGDPLELQAMLCGTEPGLGLGCTTDAAPGPAVECPAGGARRDDPAAAPRGGPSPLRMSAAEMGAAADEQAGAREEGKSGRQAWVLFAAASSARVHMNGAEVAAAAAVMAGAAAEASRWQLRAPLPPRAWPAGPPGEGPGRGRGDRGRGIPEQLPWLAELAVETGVLALTYAPGQAAADLTLTPSPPAFLGTMPAAAPSVESACRACSSLLVGCDAMTLAAAAASVPDAGGSAVGGAEVRAGSVIVAATLAQPSLWAGVRLGAAAAAVDLGVVTVPAPLAAACAVPAADGGQGTHTKAPPPEQLPLLVGEHARSPPPVRVAGSRDGPAGEPRGGYGLCMAEGVPAAPGLLAAGAESVMRSICKPALLASPVCLLVRSDAPAGAAASGTAGAAAGAQSVALSVGAVSGALDAGRLRALVCQRGP